MTLQKRAKMIKRYAQEAPDTTGVKHMESRLKKSLKSGGRQDRASEDATPPASAGKVHFIAGTSQDVER
jgi:hypothetical protein